MVDQTAEETEIETEAPSKGGGKKSLLFGLIAALALGGGSFYAVWSGTLAIPGLSGGAKETAEHKEEAAPKEALDVKFLPLETIMVSLPPGASAKFLKFTGQLEVEPGQMEDVETLMPRILDVLNTYLRAVDVKDVEQPSSSILLRAQMLRRIQVVTGEGRVRDLLVTEFVLN